MTVVNAIMRDVSLLARFDSEFRALTVKPVYYPDEESSVEIEREIQ